MDEPIKLRLLARGSAMFPDLKAMEAGARRFIGRRNDPSLGNAGGWVPHVDAVEVDTHFAEYQKAVRDGDLWPADEETARACNVEFDPKFGGEYDELAAAEKAAADKAAADAKTADATKAPKSAKKVDPPAPAPEAPKE